MQTSVTPYRPWLSDLRARVQAIGSSPLAATGERLPFGIETVDRHLAAGGLACGALHEAAANSPKLADDAAATMFVAGIAARLPRRTVLWALRWRDLFAPGLAQSGLTPDRLIQAECRRDEDVLAVMEEGLRHGGLAAVIGEISQVTMTATRRLQLAAEESGTMALMLRKWRKSDADPLAQPSSAVTRWKIACAPSEPLPVPGVGRPRWAVSLIRQRGGQSHDWILEGCDAEGRLAVPAGPRHRSAAADRGTARQAA